MHWKLHSLHSPPVLGTPVIIHLAVFVRCSVFNVNYLCCVFTNALGRSNSDDSIFVLYACVCVCVCVCNHCLRFMSAVMAEWKGTDTVSSRFLVVKRAETLGHRLVSRDLERASVVCFKETVVLFNCRLIYKNILAIFTYKRSVSCSIKGVRRVLSTVRAVLKVSD